MHFTSEVIWAMYLVAVSADVCVFSVKIFHMQISFSEHCIQIR